MAEIIAFSFTLFFPLMFMCAGTRLFKWLKTHNPFSLPAWFRYALDATVYGGMLYLFLSLFTPDVVAYTLLAALAIGAMITAHKLTYHDQEASAVARWIALLALVFSACFMLSVGFHMFMPAEYVFLAA